MFEFDFADLPEGPGDAPGLPAAGGGREADDRPEERSGGTADKSVRAGGPLFDFDDLDDLPGEAEQPPASAPAGKAEQLIEREAHAREKSQVANVAREELDGVKGLGEREDEEEQEDDEDISMMFYMMFASGEKAESVITLKAGEGIRRILTQRQLIGEIVRKKPPSAAVFVHSDPASTVKFGTWFGSLRAPVVFLEAPEPEVAEFIREDPDGPFAELDVDVRDAYWERWGFDEDKKETMLKMDWHSLPNIFTEGSCFIPRLAEGGVLQRAPPRIMAFVVAFRVVNKAVWASILDALTGLELARDTYVLHKFGEAVLQRYKKTTAARLLSAVVSAFRTQRHFGVVEAQVRWGREDHRMPSHKDGATSLLHMSITLGGRRRVWAGTFEGSNAVAVARAAPDGQRADPEVNVYDAEAWQPPRLQQFEMTKGCTYVSSPFCFEHAVEYYACDRSDPVIALQCRFCFPPDVGKLLNNVRTPEMLEVSSVIAECLRATGGAGQLRMPTLNEVVQADAQLRAQLEDKLGNQ
uniref:Uncharacterized protein n=1 Tax=Alexandrium catenella TaxID=2925 RepID=A0A7S1LSN6_ALECA|mmetsp:Transcript_11934/g.32700  ORF Transcript_11934/g.32700 Transcript_11934/m.32700 type:complete len:525 (+) Transcript_11934:66-1640(+)